MRRHDHSEKNECWVDLLDFPNYQISTHGRVRNKRNGYILKPFPDRHGYLRLSIGDRDNIYIHKLVCETFHGPKPFSNAQVNHIDSDRQNNYFWNLEWVTPRENIKWGVDYGYINPKIGLRKAREANMRPIRIVELNKKFSCVKECAEFLGVYSTNISRVLMGERKGQKIHGYHVEYVSEEGV